MVTFSRKLDKISENILYLLSLDSHMPLSTIAKHLGVTRRIVETRVKKLFSHYRVRHQLIVNNKNLLRVTVLIKLGYFEPNLIDSLKKAPSLVYLKETLGSYDIMLLFQVDDLDEIQSIVTNLAKACKNHLQALETITHDFEDSLGYKVFCHEAKLLSLYQPLTRKIPSFSKEENLLVQAIQQYPDLSYQRLSETTSLSQKRIALSLKQWKREGFIRYTIHPAYNRLGLQFHNLCVKTNVVHKKKFEHYLLNNPHIHWFKTGKGRWDYILSICSTTIAQFIDVNRMIRSENKHIILDSSALITKIDVRRKY